MNYSQKLSDAFRNQSSAAQEMAVEECDGDKDLRGSTVFEVFSRGYSLHEQAAGKPVYYAVLDEGVFFFIGTEDDILKALKERDDWYI